MLTALARHGAVRPDGARPRATCISTSTTPPRMSASCSARRCAQALGDKRGIRRFGHAAGADGRGAGRGRGRHLRPRPSWPGTVGFARAKVGEMDTELFEEFFRALAFNALLTLHVTRARRQQRPPRRRSLLQGGRPGAAHGGRARPARRRRDPLHQGRAVKVWTVHIRPGAPRPVLVRGRRSPGARLLFGPLWLLAHRAWIAGGAGAVPPRSPSARCRRGAARGVLALALAWLLGLFGHDLRRWSLARRGFISSHVVAGRRCGDAAAGAAARPAAGPGARRRLA